MMKKTNKKSKKRFFKKLKIVIAALTLQSFYITIIYYRYDRNNDTNKNSGALIHNRKDEWLVVNHKTSNNKNRKVVIVNKATTNTSTDHNTKRTTNDKKTSTILPPNNQSTDHQNPNLRSKSPSFLSSSVSIFGDEKAESNTTDTNVGLDNYQQHCGRSVVLIGIFCHLDDRNVRDGFRSLMKNPNNNNNKHGAVNACSLGSFLRSSKLSVTNSNNNRSKISDYCELIYVFVIGANNNTIPTVQTEIIDGNTRPIEMPIPDDLHSNLQDEYDHHQDDLLLLNIRQSNNSTGKTNTWFYYVSQILLKDQILYDQIDYIGKMDLGNSDTITKTTTTTATGASTSSSSFNLHQYFDFAHRNLPPSPYNQRLVAGSFIGYESLLQHWQRQMQGEVQEELLSTSTISRKHSPEQDHSSIHLDVAHVSTLWKTNPYQRDDGRAGGGAGSPMESTNNATIVETLFDFSTLALQWPSSQNSYDPSPLHIVMISRQNKFWNTLSNDVDNKNTTAVATTVDKRILTQRQAPSSKNSRSFNLGDVGVPLSNLSFKIKRHSVVLMGVFCTIKDKGLRDVFRQIFSIHPNVCSLGSYQKWILSSQHHKDTNNTRPHHPNSEDYHSCEFVYAFVIGGNTSSAAPTQIVNRSHPILYPIEEAELAEGVVYREIHKKNRDDLVVLNIRENMNEGKSQTWLYFASMVMDMYGFGDYVGKMDTDTLLYLDQYFDFARQYLSPAPYNKRTLASHFADKAWWGRPHGFDKKERYFDMHYPGPTNRTSSIHVYAQGQLYMMSLDLAKGVAEVAQRPNDGKNPYEDHMEGIEDHDVSTMAFLACGHDPINLIVINDKKKFWKHPVKRKGRWGRLWNTEINRTRLLFNGTESIAPEDPISKVRFQLSGPLNARRNYPKLCSGEIDGDETPKQSYSCGYSALERFWKLADVHNITRWSASGHSALSVVCHQSIAPRNNDNELEDINIIVSACTEMAAIWLKSTNFTNKFSHIEPMSNEKNNVIYESRSLDAEWILMMLQDRVGNRRFILTSAEHPRTAMTEQNLGGIGIQCIEDGLTSEFEIDALVRSGYHSFLLGDKPLQVLDFGPTKISLVPDQIIDQYVRYRYLYEYASYCDFPFTSRRINSKVDQVKQKEQQQRFIPRTQT